MPSLSARLIAWNRARHNKLPSRLALRADPANFTFHDDDRAIHYSDTTTNAACQQQGIANLDCKNKWWTSKDINGPYHITAGPDASLEFTFQGSSVSLMPHTESSFAQAKISVDGGQEDTLTFESPVGGDLKALWKSQLLDDSKEHTLKLTYQQKSGQSSEGSFFIGIRSFIVETTHPPADPDSLVANNNRRTISIAVGVSGACALLLVILALGFWWRRRRRNDTPPRPYSHSQRIESQVISSGRTDSYHSVVMSQLIHGTLSPWDPSRSASTENHTPGHVHSNSLDTVRTSGHQHSSSTQDLLPPPRDDSRSPSPLRNQHSHYLYDADHEPAPVPVAPSLALDIPRAVSTQNRNNRPGPRRGGQVREDVSPSNTTASYETWTSSDFGPVPSPFVANRPPVPEIPSHLRAHASDNDRGRPAVVDEKRRPNIANAKPAVGLATNRQGPVSRQSTLPPRYSTLG